jgi:hypothetical protein
MTDDQSPTEAQPSEPPESESQTNECAPADTQQTEVLTQGRPWWRRPGILGLIAGGVALITAIALVMVLVVFRDTSNQAEQQEVFLQPTDQPGQDPFSETSFATPQVPPVTDPGPDPAGPPPAQDNQVRTVYGDVDGLFGGSQNETACDAEGLITYLQQRPEKAAAWASVPQVAVNQIPSYIRQLTPVLLRNDTRVIDHGYVNGQAYSRQAVLQALTAVQVDKYGIPRVRCVSGSPLLEIPMPQAQPARQAQPGAPPAAAPAPRILRGPPIFIGTPWPRFNPRVIVVILRPLRNRIIDFIILLDLRNLRITILFARRVGIILADVALALVRPPVPRQVVAPPPAQVLPVQGLPAQRIPVQQAPPPRNAPPPPAQAPPVQAPPPVLAPAPAPVPPPVQVPPMFDPGTIFDPGPIYDPGPAYNPGPIYDPPVYDPPVYDPGPMSPHQQAPALVPQQQMPGHSEAQIPQDDPGVYVPHIDGSNTNPDYPSLPSPHDDCVLTYTC